MKKIYNKILILSLLNISVLNADLIKLKLGGGIWEENAKGISTYTDNGITGTDEVIKDFSEQQNYLWLSFNHPIPIIPNIKLEYSNINYDGLVHGSLANYSLPDSETSNSHLDMKVYEITPYYNLLDNFLWTTIDLGINIKYLETNYKIDETTYNIEGINIHVPGYEDNTEVIIPSLYLKSRIELPIPYIPIGLEGEIKYISFQGNEIQDIKVKIDLKLNLYRNFQPGIELGYRKFYINIDDNEGTVSDLTFDGLFAGMNLNF